MWRRIEKYTQQPIARFSTLNKSKETSAALELLQNAKYHYAIVEIKNRPFHVAKNDVIVTNRMNDLKLGDVIELDRVREIGSESHVLKGNPFILPDYFSIKAVCIEHQVGKDITRRHRKTSGDDKYVTNQTHHTLLRISEMSIKP